MLIDDPHWRVEWKSRKLQPPDLVPFVYEKFDAAMTRLGYEAANRQLSHQVRIAGKKVLLYGLVLYGRDPLANRLWNAAKIGVDPNYSLGL